MERRVLVAAATLLIVGVFGTSAALAHTSSTLCKNGFVIGEVSGNVTVEGRCDVGEAFGSYRVGATITGNVTVKPGGELVALSFEPVEPIIIEGGITAMHGSVVLVGGSEGSLTVDGSVQVTDSPKESAAVVVGPSTHVHGSVRVVGGTPETLLADGAVVDGNVWVTGLTGCSALGVGINDLTVGGSVAFGKNALEGCEGVGVSGDSVGGDLRVFENSTDRRPLEVTQNHVGHRLSVRANVAPKIDVSENTVTSELICTLNSPAPEGSGNTAASKHGQCKAL